MKRKALMVALTIVGSVVGAVVALFASGSVASHLGLVLSWAGTIALWLSVFALEYTVAAVARRRLGAENYGFAAAACVLASLGVVLGGLATFQSRALSRAAFGGDAVDPILGAYFLFVHDQQARLQSILAPVFWVLPFAAGMGVLMLAIRHRRRSQHPSRAAVAFAVVSALISLLGFGICVGGVLAPSATERAAVAPYVEETRQALKSPYARPNACSGLGRLVQDLGPPVLARYFPSWRDEAGPCVDDFLRDVGGGKRPCTESTIRSDEIFELARRTGRFAEMKAACLKR